MSSVYHFFVTRETPEMRDDTIYFFNSRIVEVDVFHILDRPVQEIRHYTPARDQVSRIIDSKILPTVGTFFCEDALSNEQWLEVVEWCDQPRVRSMEEYEQRCREINLENQQESLRRMMRLMTALNL